MVATDTIMPSLPMRIVGKTASKLVPVIETAPDPGPRLVVALEEAALACIVAVPAGPM